MKFSDLEFKSTDPLMGGVDAIQAFVFFSNGYGASVVRNNYSYGGKDGLYELAVIEGTAKDWSICYDTHITYDVLGFLTPIEVGCIVNQVKELTK